MEHHAQFEVREITQVGYARRHAVRIAESMAMDQVAIGNIAIVVTELANNLHRFTTEGRLLIRCIENDGFEVIAIDRGPGMDVNRCMQDGYSTGGTPGTGLGAVKRLSTNFDIYSTPSNGTVVWAKINKGGLTSENSRFQFGGISLPAPGENECGDAWDVEIRSEGIRVVVADGLGHGFEAAKASAQVIREFRRPNNVWNAKTFLEHTHIALAGTRGAAVAAGQLLHDASQFNFAGIGNISATILSTQGSRGLMSHNGTLGARVRSVQAIEYDWPPEGMLIMHTDGLFTRWNENLYPGIFTRHPAILAALLVRDYTRGRDDVTAVIVRRR